MTLWQQEQGISPHDTGLVSRGGFSVGFWIGMLSTDHWLEMLQRAKKGVETIHFVKCWPKIGVEIRHFPHFCSNIGAETIQIFQRPKKGGRNGGAYVVTFIVRVPSPGLVFKQYFVCIQRVTDTMLFWENYVTTMAVDALAPCLTRPSSAMILKTYVKWKYSWGWISSTCQAISMSRND